MVHRLLSYTSLLCTALVALSFALFVIDQAGGASKHQQNELAPLPASTTVNSSTPHKHAQPRRFIDGAAHALTSPFDGLVSSSNAWVDHGIPAVLGLLVYGVGLSFLARVAKVGG